MFKKSLIFLAAALLVSAAQAEAPVSFDRARSMLYERSHKLKADDALLESKRQASEALKTAGGPTLSIQAVQIAGQKEIDLDKNMSLPVPGSLSPMLGSSLNVPLSLHEKYSLNGPRASATAFWPIYAGGKIEAGKAASKYEVDEAYAMKRASVEELDAQLAGYYFGLQLAVSVENLRRDMLAQQDKELKRALKFEKLGTISRVERMSVQVARDNMHREYLKAKDNADVARTQLMRLLQDTHIGELTTPLFVLNTPLKPLAYWQNEAFVHNPQLAMIDAKANRAAQGVKAAEAAWHPQVFAFGQYNFIKHYQTLVEPNWIGGIGVNITLWSAKDRRASVRSAEALVAQAEAGKAEALDAVKTNVEIAWLKTQNAIEQYRLAASTVALARENLELKSKGFGEGLTTALDVTEARNQLYAAEVGRRLASFEFVSNYAVLHAICGRMSEFMNDYKAKRVIVEN